MQLSVIILNYNVRYFLEACIRSVQAAISELNAEIIVIDNNSPDDSCDMMQNTFPNIQLIPNTENVGFAKANNQGVKIAKGKYICILNPDTIVAEDTFTQLLKFAETTENLGSIGCKLIDGSGMFLPESKRNIPTPMVSVKKILGNKNSGYYSSLDENDIGKVDILVGAFMFMEKNVYENVQGFDEDYFMYGEDIDLSYKIKKAGFQNYYYGKTTVIHYKGESTLKDKTYAKRFYGAMQLFYKKHFKRNLIYDVAVTLGAKLIPLVSSSEKEAKKQVQKYIFVSDSAERFKKIKAVYHPKECTRVENLGHLLRQIKNENSTEIILDNHFVDTKMIIQIVEKQLGYYKILPKNSTFIIGSDSSKNRGEVQLLNISK
ncbi:glycosyltransferase family 2 protein [Kordia algicida OT-1]|uniref:B-glycosyltransferase, glycosyltransferase family 2 protein n=1 Tax=Kordia algicida OT-1 TaxID=391587 RepID=A9E2Z9_9FLAO|nr:glycosyltransferase family 2 protein [Kordia algicida]EDP95448.1 b-glycosyltransferase, glycosyltransferase family 2 protein [Kordia algicida OT-1]